MHRITCANLWRLMVSETQPTQPIKVIPIKRHRQLDRITANELCKQAGLVPVFLSRMNMLPARLLNLKLWPFGARVLLICYG